MHELSFFNPIANLSFKNTSVIFVASPYNLYCALLLLISPPLFVFPIVTTVPSNFRAIKTFPFTKTSFTPDVNFDDCNDKLFIILFEESSSLPQT